MAGIVNGTRDNMMDQIDADIGASGKLRIYSGTQPATGGAETTILATLPLSATAFGASSAGVLTANAITSDTNCAASGTPTWARLMTSADVAVMDLTAGVSSGEVSFDNTIVATGTAACSSLVLTEGTP